MLNLAIPNPMSMTRSAPKIANRIKALPHVESKLTGHECAAARLLRLQYFWKCSKVSKRGFQGSSMLAAKKRGSLSSGVIGEFGLGI